MESSTQYFWKESFGSIYPVLEALEKQKLIVKLDTPRKNDRKRNVYALTPAGKEMLKNWLIQSPEEIQLRNELLLKLFFGNLVPIQISIEHLEHYKKEVATKLSSFREIEQQLRCSDAIEMMYGLITLDHGIRQAISSLEWCDQAIKTLKSIERKKLK